MKECSIEYLRSSLKCDLHFAFANENDAVRCAFSQVLVQANSGEVLNSISIEKA